MMQIHRNTEIEWWAPSVLGRKMNIPDVNWVVDRAMSVDGGVAALFDLAKSADTRAGCNALWCLTHVQRRDGRWLLSVRDELIDMLLSEESHTGRKECCFSCSGSRTMMMRRKYAPIFWIIVSRKSMPNASLMP